jgi:hypothetical protein
MTIRTLTEIINGHLVTKPPKDDLAPEFAFASDLMSDVLTIEDHSPMLITGLSNPQTIRTAEMADIRMIILARGKKTLEDMIELADENNITIIETPFSVFKTSGILFGNGIKPIF